MTKPPEKLHQSVMVSPLVVSAPTSPKQTLAPETGSHGTGMKRSNSCIDNKYKCIVTSERLSRLRKTVETAVKEHKVFTIRGGWPVIRRELLKRNWIEKFEHNIPKVKSNPGQTQNSDYLIGNLPVKNDGESPAAYIEKCEKTIMSRMLHNADANFYWNSRKDDFIDRSNPYRIVNRFRKSLFASKEGLGLLLQQHYWYTEPGTAAINFPRCYVLGFPEHYNNFVEDFRVTASLGLLKWFVHKYDTDRPNIQSTEGKVPFSALEFAIDRSNQYLDIQKHVDIDKDFPQIWNHEWDQFLTHYCSIVYKNGMFSIGNGQPLTTYYLKAKNILNELSKILPERNMLDGMRNIWILKPGNKCRGRGIQLIKDIQDVDKVMNSKLKFVVQKYIERPLLIYKTKFDIRQWFLVTSTQPLMIWMYRECYLRFSGQIFNLDNFHESLHLTNHAVQCKYKNIEQRDKALPQNNMWDSHMFQTYLKQIGAKDKWNDVIAPGIREALVCAMLASQDVMDRRPNTFEIYGADFMISEDFRPWLIEINGSPDLSCSTSVTARMCPQCQEDLIKVVIDKQRNPLADTGLFDLIYRQTLPRVPPYLGMNLQVRGRKIFRKSSKSKIPPKEKSGEIENITQSWLNRKHEFKPEMPRSSTAPTSAPITSLPKLSSPIPVLYKGPVINDLIDDLDKAAMNKSPDNTRNKSPSEILHNKSATKVIKKKRECTGNKRETRVSKKERYCKSKINKINFISRKQNSKENIKFEESNCQKSKYLGIFNEWASKNYKSDCNEIQTQKDNGFWERETASILKGKNTLNGAQNDDVGNKNCFKSNYCFNLVNGNLLPRITANCNES